MRERKGTIARNGNAGTTGAHGAPLALIAGIVSRFVIGRSSIPTPESDALGLTELFEERAAIREFDGGLSRVDAEILAREDVQRMQEPPR